MEAGKVQRDIPQGNLTFASFRIADGNISFLIGGGCNADVVRAELIVNNKVRIKTRCQTSLRMSLPNYFENLVSSRLQLWNVVSNLELVSKSSLRNSLRRPNTVFTRAQGFQKQTCRQKSDHFIYSIPALTALFFFIIERSELMANSFVKKMLQKVTTQRT